MNAPQSKRVTEAVDRTGLTRQKVANALGISTAQLRNYERGISHIPEGRMEILEQLSGGALRPSDPAAPPVATRLAHIPAVELIEELARRARGGQLRDAA